MDGQSRKTEKIGQMTKNEDKQNKEPQHRKLKKISHGPHQKKRNK
jgi:hypothetical protein